MATIEMYRTCQYGSFDEAANVGGLYTVIPAGGIQNTVPVTDQRSCVR